MLLVAEIGLNHEGNFDLACELIRQAKWAGADIAKFQFGWRGKPGELNHINTEIGARLKKCCDDVGIEMMASLFTEEALDLARSLGLRRYKIASRTVIDDPALCKRILSEEKPTYVSLGMWNERQFPFGNPDGKTLHYIYCRSKYPTAAEDLVGMPSAFSPSGYYGYSDHMLGTQACLLAAARGAGFVEKHFTLNKASQTIRDHLLSAEPWEFKRMAEEARPLSRLCQSLSQKK